MALWKFTDEIGCFFPEEISKRTLPNGNISSKVIVGSCIVNDAIIADIDGIVLIQTPINTDNIASMETPILLCLHIKCIRKSFYNLVNPVSQRTHTSLYTVDQMIRSEKAQQLLHECHILTRCDMAAKIGQSLFYFSNVLPHFPNLRMDALHRSEFFGLHLNNAIQHMSEGFRTAPRCFFIRCNAFFNSSDTLFECLKASRLFFILLR